MTGQAQSAATDIFATVLKSLGPTSGFQPSIFNEQKQGAIFEDVMQGAICGILASATSAYSQFSSYIHYEPGIAADGTPLSDGRFECGNTGDIVGPLQPRPTNRYYPDFVIKQGGPATTDRKPPAFLTGDFKRQVTTIKPTQSQWDAIMGHARAVWQVGPVGFGSKSNRQGHQFAPVAVYATLFGSSKRNQSKEKNLEKRALREYGVALKIISFL